MQLSPVFARQSKNSKRFVTQGSCLIPVLKSVFLTSYHGSFHILILENRKDSSRVREKTGLGGKMKSSVLKVSDKQSGRVYNTDRENIDFKVRKRMN